MRSFTALLRREIWEHKVFLVLPLTLLIIVVLANLMLILVDQYASVSMTLDSGESIRSLRDLQQTFVDLPAREQSLTVNGTLIVTGMIINAVMMIMGVFYVLDSLYADRKDQSILFWKSLPISDTKTVMSKLVVAIVVIPLLILVTSMTAWLSTIGIQAFAMREIPEASSLLWQQADFGTLWSLTALILFQQEIWYFPATGWLLLCSAWSKKTPIIIAVLIPMLILFIDTALGQRTGISEALVERLPLAIMSVESDAATGMLNYQSEAGGFKFGLTIDDGAISINADAARNLLADPQVWTGLAIGGLFVWLAIWLRRWRDDSL